MLQIMEAVTKGLELEDPFKDLVADHWATLSSRALSFLFEANSSWNTALDYGLIELCYFLGGVSGKPWRCSKIINFTDVA